MSDYRRHRQCARRKIIIDADIRFHGLIGIFVRNTVNTTGDAGKQFIDQAVLELQFHVIGQLVIIGIMGNGFVGICVEIFSQKTVISPSLLVKWPKK